MGGGCGSGHGQSKGRRQGSERPKQRSLGLDGRKSHFKCRLSVLALPGLPVLTTCLTSTRWPTANDRHGLGTKIAHENKLAETTNGILFQ